MRNAKIYANHIHAADSVPALLREWMLIADLSKYDVAERLGLSHRTVEDILQGRRTTDGVLARIGLKTLIREATEERNTRLTQPADSFDPVECDKV